MTPALAALPRATVPFLPRGTVGLEALRRVIRALRPKTA
jgi:hypothetical protein